MRNRFVIAMLTGFAVLAGGINPVAAGVILSFSVNVSDPHTLLGPGAGQTAVTTTGTFSGSMSDPTPFLQFDTLGGTRVLNSVVITLPASSATLTASVDCDGIDFPTCTAATAQNTSTFSVGIDAPLGAPLEFHLLPLTQLFSSLAATCDLCDSGEDSDSSSPGVNAFTLTIDTPADLNAFIGGGSFYVTPLVSLSGAFSATNDNNTDVSASTEWGGTIEVTFNFTDVSAVVSEPASLFLLAAGLAGLGFARRRRQVS